MCRAGGQPPSKVVVQHSTRAKTTGCGAFERGLTKLVGTLKRRTKQKSKQSRANVNKGRRPKWSRAYM